MGINSLKPDALVLALSLAVDHPNFSLASP